VDFPLKYLGLPIDKSKLFNKHLVLIENKMGEELLSREVVGYWGKNHPA
jgi:hypothetical protein